MFKLFTQIKKKILAVSMAVAILAYGNINLGCIKSGDHPTETTLTVSAATIYTCKYSARGCQTKKKLKESIIKHEKHCPFRMLKCTYECGFETESQTALNIHQQNCPKKPKTKYKCQYNIYNCPRTFDNVAAKQKHEAECPYKKGKICPYCGDKYKDLTKYNMHVTYNCKKNPNRQVSESYQSDLKKLKAPRWDVYRQTWVCRYCEDGDTNYTNPVQYIVVSHITTMHKRYQ